MFLKNQKQTNKNTNFKKKTIWVDYFLHYIRYGKKGAQWKAAAESIALNIVEDLVPI